MRRLVHVVDGGDIGIGAATPSRASASLGCAVAVALSILNYVPGFHVDLRKWVIALISVFRIVYVVELRVRTVDDCVVGSSLVSLL